MLLEVKQEKQVSEVLLLNILPEEVAKELKANGDVQPKLFENVTVFFSDFVNFTIASDKMTPQQLVAELHECFKAFDTIMSKHGIEKIKTVGDAYLAVSGLPEPNAMHADAVVKAALEVRDFMRERKNLLGNSTFGIRIGINSGTVVAGIVGVRKFAYDIWGDTVNVAARMEQNSEDGKVNISEKTRELLAGEFALTDRGVLNVKNKGEMRMYFVEPVQVGAIVS
jgi:adenylate cyclase